MSVKHQRLYAAWARVKRPHNLNHFSGQLPWCMAYNVAFATDGNSRSVVKLPVGVYASLGSIQAGLRDELKQLLQIFVL